MQEKTPIIKKKKSPRQIIPLQAPCLDKAQMIHTNHHLTKLNQPMDLHRQNIPTHMK